MLLDATDRIIVATGDSINEALEAAEGDSSFMDWVAGWFSEPDIVAAPDMHEAKMMASGDLAEKLTLCKMRLTNPPQTDGNGYIRRYQPLKNVSGVQMAMMPTKEGCLSSGFGNRRGKLHKGVDYYNKSGGMVFAAADGQILEAEYRDDYGFTVLLNHGNGYYTRYAHLAGFEKSVKVGAAVPRGFALGPIGQTAGFAVPKHLHFELLQGDYNNPKKSFGLEAVDIYAL